MLPVHKPLPWILVILSTTCIWLAMALFSPASRAEETMACAALWNSKQPRLHSKDSVDLCQLTAGKPVLVVNTASHCGFTPQFRQLEALHQKYSDQGLVVIGVPSDDFRQEADSEAETASVCYRNYGVSFTMLAPMSVKGPNAVTFFASINAQSEEPGWNFNKYLVDANGSVVRHWGSRTSPLGSELEEAVIQLVQ